MLVCLSPEVGFVFPVDCVSDWSISFIYLSVWHNVSLIISLPSIPAEVDIQQVTGNGKLQSSCREYAKVKGGCRSKPSGI